MGHNYGRGTARLCVSRCNRCRIYWHPGKRTFRLRILRGDDSAALWMEKQQLAALGEALPRLLEQLNTPDQHADEDAESIASFPDDPTIEFKVGRMALGYAAAGGPFGISSP